MKNKNKKSFSAIILAAGKGVRMNSSLPKVLHPVAGEPMILRILKQTRLAGAIEARVVVGYGENLVRQVVEPTGAVCMKQVQQNGTADAVRAAQPETLEGPVLIVNGDHPLITADDLRRVLEDFNNSTGQLTLVTAKVKKPASYGRIVRSKGELRAIVEAKDASAETLKINEVNTGIYMVDAGLLTKLLKRVTNNNAQKEFYLTDIISLAIEDKIPVSTVTLNSRVASGVNSQAELAAVTKKIFKRKVEELMTAGVLVLDPATTYIEDDVEIGASSVLYPNVFIKAGTRLGPFCVVEPGCFLQKVTAEEGVHLKAHSHMEDCVIRARAVVGPFARIRPETEIGRDARVGNFVEMKKVKFGDGAKAGHLTYLGDADIGEGTNIGCGTITCNYAADKKKYKTTIGKNVFVGSDTQFVAPIHVGDEAIIGSGSTITKDVPAKALAVARGKQIVKENYKPKAPEQKKD